MFDRLKTYFTTGNSFYGLEIYQRKNNISYQVLEVIRKKGELHIINSHTFEDFEAVARTIKKSTPICLVYNTKSVITKPTESSTLKQMAAVEALFPGLDFDSFYYQIQMLGKSSFISICKKQELDSIIAQFTKNKLNVVGISLGPSSIAPAMEFFEKEQVYTNTEKIIRHKGTDHSFSISRHEQSHHESYILNGLKVNNIDLPAFSSIIGFIMEGSELNSNFGHIVDGLKNTFASNRSFALLLRYTVLFVLGILMVNFLVFSHYFTKTEQLRASLSLDVENKKNLILIKESVDEKEIKVDAIVSFSNSKTSFYLDRLASTVPESIQMSEIQYQPLQMPIQASKPIVLGEGIIMVMGTSADHGDFSQWIVQLEQLEWVSKVETKDYDYRNNNSSEFKAEITIEATKK